MSKQQKNAKMRQFPGEFEFEKKKKDRTRKKLKCPYCDGVYRQYDYKKHLNQNPACAKHRKQNG